MKHESIDLLMSGVFFLENFGVVELYYSSFMVGVVN